MQEYDISQGIPTEKKATRKRTTMVKGTLFAVELISLMLGVDIADENYESLLLAKASSFLMEVKHGDATHIEIRESEE